MPPTPPPLTGLPLETNPPKAKSGNLPLHHLDGVRGFLTVLVLLAHIRASLIYNPNDPVIPALFRSASMWIQPALYSVGVFIVLSGYCLMIPVARSAQGNFRGGVGDYLWRRARRILPPYYVSIAVSIVLLYFFPMQFGIGPNSAQIQHHSFAPNVIWTHALVVHNLFLDTRYGINAPLWTVATEWQLYLLFPFALIPLWRHFGILGLTAGAFAMGFLPLLFGGDLLNWHTWYIFLFAVGMAGAAIQFPQRALEMRWRLTIPWGRIAALMYGAFAIAWGVEFFWINQSLQSVIPTWWMFCIHETWLGAATVAFMVHCGKSVSALPVEGWSLPHRVLNHRFLTGIGVFSYSHYLIHFPTVMALRHLTEAWHLSTLSTVVVMYGVGGPLSLGVGFVFFLAVERRFLPGHLRPQPAVGLQTESACAIR